MKDLLARLFAERGDTIVAAWNAALRRLPDFASVPEDETLRNVEACFEGYRALLESGDEAPLRAFATNLADRRYAMGFSMHAPLAAAGRFVDGVLAALDAEGARIAPSLLVEVQRLYEGFAHHFTARFASNMLLTAEDAFRRLLDGATDPIGLLDEAGVVVGANGAFARMLGLARSAVVGEPARRFVVPADRDRFDEAIARLEHTGTAICGIRIAVETADGTPRTVELSAHRSHAQHRPATLVFLRDITELEHARARTIQRDTLLAMGRLAASMTHELNNPLTWVLGNLQQARDDVDRLGGATACAEVRDMLEDALAGARRMAAIVRDFRGFIGGDTPEPAVYQPREVLDLAIRIASVQARGRLRVERDLADLPQAVGLPGRLSQVFVNLVVNAIDATKDVPTPKVTVRARPCEERDGYWVLVEDNGCGIDANALSRLFDPFFTTGKTGGMGLGLWVTREIVEAHGGAIAVESQPGRTVFEVFLSNDGGGRWQNVPRTAAATGGVHRPRLLLVEDEDLLRRALSRQLRRIAEVEAVGTAEEALARLEEDTAYDAVISDVGLPGMDGLALRVKTEAIAPSLARRFVLISGVSDFEGAPDDTPCLRKPFSRQELEEALAKVIPAQRAAGARTG